MFLCIPVPKRFTDDENLETMDRQKSDLNRNTLTSSYIKSYSICFVYHALY